MLAGELKKRNNKPLYFNDYEKIRIAIYGK